MATYIVIVYGRMNGIQIRKVNDEQKKKAMEVKDLDAFWGEIENGDYLDLDFEPYEYFFEDYYLCNNKVSGVVVKDEDDNDIFELTNDWDELIESHLTKTNKLPKTSKNYYKDGFHGLEDGTYLISSDDYIGCEYRFILELEDEFDPSKLKFKTCSVLDDEYLYMGDIVIPATNVYYDGESLEQIGIDDCGSKGWTVYLCECKKNKWTELRPTIYTDTNKKVMKKTVKKVVVKPAPGPKKPKPAPGPKKK